MREIGCMQSRSFRWPRSSNCIQSREPASEERYSAATTDIDTLIRKVFDRPAALATPVETRSQSRRDPETAFDLLDRAAAAFDILLNRSQQLEQQMQDAAERARMELAKQQKVADDWKKLASGMKAHAEETERRFEVMKTRSDAAEARALAAETRSAALEKSSQAAALKVAAAESRSSEFHDRVVASFGMGSRAYVALEAASSAPSRPQQASAA